MPCKDVIWRLVDIDSVNGTRTHFSTETHLFSQNTVRFRHVWQGIIQIGNTNAFMIISR